MAQKASFFPVAGGLDETTQAIAVPRGAVIGCMNHESVFQGYGRIAGYERFDGRTSPTDAYNAELDAADGAVARENARTAITTVPGTGPVRGVWSMDGVVYAWRDNVAMTKTSMFKATAVGWEEVDLGHTLAFNSGGTYEIQPGDVIVGATSGKTATVRKVIVTTGAVIGGTAEGYLVISAPSGPFEAENLNVGLNTNVATISGTSQEQSFPPGGRYDFETHNFYGSSSMRCFYGANGVGRGFEVDLNGVVTLIETTPDDTIDKPTKVTVYKDHLFFGFPSGSVIHSVPGEPTLFDGSLGAGEIALGNRVSGLAVAPGGALFVFGETKVSAIYGSNIDDWTVEVVTDEGGAFDWTVQRTTQVIYMDNQGVRGVTASRDYGNYRMATLTQNIANTLRSKAQRGVLPTASCVVKDKAQYRLFFDDGSGISIFFGRKYPESMTFFWEDAAAFCACTTKEELGQERVFIGSVEGYVYELEVGTSFDGQPIEAYLQFAFDHEGAPLTYKRWYKVTFEMVAAPNTNIGVAAEFDYSGTDQPGLGVTNLTVTGGGGGLWSINNWDDFYWSSPVAGVAENWIEGMGLNMSVIVVSTSAEQMPYIIQGVTKSFTIRGTRR